MPSDQIISVDQLYGAGNLFPPPDMPTHCTTPSCNNRTDKEYPFWCSECCAIQTARLTLVKQEISDRMDTFLRAAPAPTEHKPTLHQEQVTFEEQSRQ